MTPLEKIIPYGTCHCGCGEKTSVILKNHTAHGYIKGNLHRFISGHQRTKTRIDFSDAAPFKIDGVYCKLISLTKGQFAIVDAADYEWLIRWKWSAVWSKCTCSYYAGYSSKSKSASMHRLILGLNRGNPIQGDHGNGVTLDNRRNNLRLADHSQQRMNQARHRDNTSGHKGVYRSKGKGKFIAYITVNKVRIYLGSYDTFNEACAVREDAEMKYFGEFSRTI